MHNSRQSPDDDIVTQRDHLNEFLHAQELPDDYLPLAEHWYLPLANTIQQQASLKGAPLLVSINGCQGSGKSTLAEYLATILRHEHHLSVATLSIDDFYLTRNERLVLGSKIHPLLQTRGVPGTHDTELLQRTLTDLSHNKGHVGIPRFDKARDDRATTKHWDQAELPVDVIILEGWCMGAQPTSEQKLASPINDLEKNEDPDGSWRHYVNTQLRTRYLPIFDQFDLWIMLKAPTFNNVFQWRLEQEQKLIARQPPESGHLIMNEAAILRFIQHYQRLTENCLKELSPKVHFLFELDNNRQPQQLSQPLPLQRRAEFLT